MIRQVMLDPARLRRCIDSGEGVDDERTARELARIAGQIKVIDDERRRIIDLYAAEKMAGDEYITANRTLDKDLERLIRAKADLAAASRSSQTPPSPAEPGWGCRSAAPSSIPRGVGFGRRRMDLAGPYFSSPCPMRKTNSRVLYRQFIRRESRAKTQYQVLFINWLTKVADDPSSRARARSTSLG
jgi:hypothetical protein